MNNTPAVLWHEWFNKEREADFRKATENIWELLLRNGIATTVFKKWLREQVCSETTLEETKNTDRIDIINKWVSERNISKDDFEKDKNEILSQYKIREKSFDIYCDNELKAIQWAKDKWEGSTPQLYLEYKDRFDMIKLKILSVEEKEKGIILEVYQQLKEKEVDFSEIAGSFPVIKYSSDKQEGSWYKMSEMKKEISYRAERLKMNTVCRPFKLDNRYIIIELIDRKGTKLNDEIKEELEIMQFNKFLNYGVAQLLDLAYEG